MQTLAIFDALSTADIRFHSVDVSEVPETPIKERERATKASENVQPSSGSLFI
jgi:hypothetical protein